MGRRYIILLPFLLWLSACSATHQAIGERLGPAVPAEVTVSSWAYEGQPAFCLTTAHYQIFTTLADANYARQVAQVMEAGYTQYQRLLPSLSQNDRPMKCYVFATREQWADFTRRNTGVIANIYLQINRGGYTLRDWFVAYDIGDVRTYSVSAHEGWHQFAYRNFIGRLPPFLEEGIACMFEDVKMNGDLPRFNWSVNRTRTTALRRAVDTHRLISLQELTTLHAGEVVGQSGSVIETFYAENWAFARFLWEGEHGKYRPALLRLIADTATGEVYDPTGSHRRAAARWNGAAVAPLLEHYFNMSMEELSEHYFKYVRQITYEEYGGQFAS